MVQKRKIKDKWVWDLEDPQTKEYVHEQKRKKSQLDANVYKVAIGTFFNWDTSMQNLIAKACVALGFSELLKDVIAYCYIDYVTYVSETSELVLHIKVQPFFKHLKEDLYKRSGLYPETVFIFSFITHFKG